MAKKSMRVRAKEKDGVVTVKALISHPMETGLRKDENGETVPAHFIKEVTATVGGEVVFVANWGTGVSKNPYLSFKYRGAKGDLLTLRWEDNRGGSDQLEAEVK